MNIDEDSTLVNRIQDTNDENALHELIVRHSGIYIDMVRKFGSNCLNSNQISDIMNDKDYQIYKAALEYDSSRCKFSTYLALKTKYLCLTNKVQSKKHKNFINFDEVEYNKEDSGKSPVEEFCINESLNQIVELITNHSDNRVTKIFNERYFASTNGKLTPWKKIANKLNLSIQGCINIHDKALQEFKKNISNEKANF